MKLSFISVFFCLLPLGASPWGFFAHTRINHLAVFTLPAGMGRFYKAHIRYLSEHAPDADKRRYADTSEAPRHYLDVENYAPVIDSIPEKWETALALYGATKMSGSGILPWQIQRSYHQLVDAFKKRDAKRILSCSAFLGHYLSDAHVPLHTTSNHNGQLTGQQGIHAFWESRLPELFAEKYNFRVGPARYIERLPEATWAIVRHSHQLADSVLRLEAELNRSFPAYRKYSFSVRNKQVTRQYAYAYAEAYHTLLNHMVERQMRSSVLQVGSYWFSAWADAGQPDLDGLN